ncbi:MAG TPA: response regulator transcription factor [Gemmatimonadaceae bacterium]|nr:response regulator transcription factor [Gemmatimonadaceae bacterium]
MPPKDTILIADDDRVMVAMLAEFLRKKGFNVVTAFDSMQAMLGVRNTTPKAVVLDVNMPGGNGVDVLRKIRAMNKTSQLPVLIITASTDPGIADEARGLGADEFLTKPVNLPEFHAALLRALGRPPEETEGGPA